METSQPKAKRNTVLTSRIATPLGKKVGCFAETGNERNVAPFKEVHVAKAFHEGANLRLGRSRELLSKHIVHE